MAHRSLHQITINREFYGGGKIATSCTLPCKQSILHEDSSVLPQKEIGNLFGGVREFEFLFSC